MRVPVMRVNIGRLAGRTKIKLLRDWRGLKKDTVINPPGNVTRVLVRRGWAAKVREAPAIEKPVKPSVQVSKAKVKEEVKKLEPKLSPKIEPATQVKPEVEDKADG